MEWQKIGLLLESFEQFLQRIGIEDVILGDPSPSSLMYTEFHVVQFVDLVSVCIDCYFQSQSYSSP